MKRGQSSFEYLYNFAFAMILIVASVYALRSLGVVSLTSILKERSQEISSKIETLGVISKSVTLDGSFIVVIKNNSENALVLNRVAVHNDFSPKNDPLFKNPTNLFCNDGFDRFGEFNITTLYPDEMIALKGIFNPCGLPFEDYCSTSCGDMLDENSTTLRYCC